MTINCPINSLAFSTLSSFFPPLFSPFSNVSPSAREACGDTLSADQFYTNLDRLNRDQPREVIISRSILFESFSFFEPIKNGERREEMLSIKNIANATRIYSKNMFIVNRWKGRKSVATRTKVLVLLRSREA